MSVNLRNSGVKEERQWWSGRAPKDQEGEWKEQGLFEKGLKRGLSFIVLTISIRHINQCWKEKSENKEQT